MMMVGGVNHEYVNRFLIFRLRTRTSTPEERGGGHIHGPWCNT